MLKKNVTMCALLLVAVMSAASFGGESLYMFYPSPIRSNVVQQMVQGEISDVDVTVFGKYRDFALKVKADEPEALLCPTETARTLKSQGYSTVASAQKDGAEKIEYVLLSIGEAVTPADLTEASVIGVVDIMGRNEMNEYVKGFVGKKVRVKHVTKIDDLLPLLSFRMAQAVLIPKARVAYFQGKSNQSFAVTTLSEKGAVAQVVSKGGDASASLEAAKVISKKLPDYILGGVEWK
ncbi:MAG: hypothetical protein ACQEQV_00105 [Fibrobacterota bacterium]